MDSGPQRFMLSFTHRLAMPLTGKPLGLSCKSVLKMTPTPAFLPFLVLCIAVGCGDDSQRNKTFVGHYESGFENSSFRACGESDFWWVEGKLDKIAEFIDDPANFPSNTSSPASPTTPTGTDDYSYKRVFTKLRGDLSEEGRYGHLGAASRLLNVKEVYWVRMQSDSDCK